jgi:hypothetical protein
MVNPPGREMLAAPTIGENMSRLRAAALALTMAASSLVTVAVAGPASAARAPMAPVVVVEGKTCAKVGAKSTVRSTQYVCTKSGSKAVWRVNAATVKAGRGCTKVAELAEVGARKALFSCFRNTQKALVWKAASKDCKEAVAVDRRSRQDIAAVSAQIAAVEKAAQALPAADMASSLAALAGLKATIRELSLTSQEILRPSVTLMCSL